MMNGLWWGFFSGLWWDSIAFGLWFWVPFSAIIVALLWAYRRSKPIEHWKLALLMVLPLMWVVFGVVPDFDWGQKHLTRDPDWILYPAASVILVYLACAIGLVAYLRGARLFASLFALLNLYFMLHLSLLAIISYSGQSR
jgi:hypothetical protein